MKIETIKEFLAREGKITVVKPTKRSNYCPYCETWNSLESYYFTEDRQCLYCFRWLNKKKKGEKI